MFHEDINTLMKVLCHLGPDEERWHWQLYFGSTLIIVSLLFLRGRRGRDRMAVEFSTTCAISAYHR